MRHFNIFQHGLHIVLSDIAEASKVLAFMAAILAAVFGPAFLATNFGAWWLTLYIVPILAYIYAIGAGKV